MALFSDVHTQKKKKRTFPSVSIYYRAEGKCRLFNTSEARK